MFSILKNIFVDAFIILQFYLRGMLKEYKKINNRFIIDLRWIEDRRMYFVINTHIKSIDEEKEKLYGFSQGHEN